MKIFAALFMIFCIIALPIFMQRTAHQNIDEDKFKLYKIKHLKFLFVGMQFSSVSSHGIILPMLIIQIQGYILGLLWIILLVCGIIFDFVTKTIVIIIIILFIHAIVSVVITIITGYVSNNRKAYKK